MGLGNVFGDVLVKAGQKLGSAIGTAAEEVTGGAISKKGLALTGARALKSGGADLVNLAQRTILPGRTVLNSWGEAGQALSKNIDGVLERAKPRAGLSYNQAMQAIKGFNDVEVGHVVDILDKGMQPSHSKYAQAAGTIRGILDQYSEDAMGLNLQEYSSGQYNILYKRLTEQGVPHEEAVKIAAEKARHPFTPREDYFPHYFSEGAIARYMAPGPQKEQILRALQNQYGGIDRREAEYLLERMLRQPAEFRGGPLQHARDFYLDGYERDPRTVLKRYFSTSAKRLETARTFGTDDALAKELINKIGEGGGDKAIASNLYNSFADSTDPKYRNLNRLTSAIHSITLLSTAGIIQPAQMINTVARAGWTNTIKAMSVLAKDWAKQEGGWASWAESTGATMDSIRSDLQVNSIGDLSQVWLKLIGMEALDKNNRLVSAVAGRFYAEELAKKLGKPLGSNQLTEARRQLTRLGLDADMIVQRGQQTGKFLLAPDELRRAGYTVARDTQFATEALDMPEFRGTPAGRFMYLFKTFAYQQSQFNYGLVKEAVYHRNYGPLARYIAVLPPVAVLGGEMLRAVKGRERPDTEMKTVLEDFAMVGAFGSLYDGARALGGGPSSVYNWVLGPTAAEAAQIAGADLPPLVTGPLKGEAPDFMPLVRHMVRRTPLIGQYVAHAWWGQ